MKHFKKIESKFLFSLLIMSVWSIIAVGQTTAKISKHIPEIEKWIQKQFAKGKTPPFSFICDGKPSAEFIRQWDYSQQKIESEEADVIKYLFDLLQSYQRTESRMYRKRLSQLSGCRMGIELHQQRYEQLSHSGTSESSGPCHAIRF